GTSTTCAQRLSASMDSARETRRSSKTPSGVLNACRHKWILHTRRLVCVNTSRLSAQRLSTSMDSTRHSKLGVHLCKKVLNACRHQWILHTIYDGTVDPRVWCSTPVGINGFCTGAWCSSTFMIVRCSTPVGINGFCTDVSNVVRQWFHCAQRLSASMDS